MTAPITTVMNAEGCECPKTIMAQVVAPWKQLPLSVLLQSHPVVLLTDMLLKKNALWDSSLCFC